jgi:hypothetical protein
MKNCLRATILLIAIAASTSTNVNTTFDGPGYPCGPVACPTHTVAVP